MGTRGREEEMRRERGAVGEEGEGKGEEKGKVDSDREG